MPDTQQTTPPTKKLKTFIKKPSQLIVIVAGIILLLGASAGAYYGVIVPNKPENVLKAAFRNTLTQKKAKFNGKVSYENIASDAELKAVTVTMEGESDVEKNAFQVASEISAAGAKLPVEIRSVDKSIYFKVGDLASIKALTDAVSPEASAAVNQISKKLADQWYVADETLLKEADADCALNSSFALTQADIDMLIDRYEQAPFASVKSSNDTVNGQAAIKYEIEIDDNKGAEYAKGLDQLSIVKKLSECSASDELDKDSLTESLADNDKTPVTIWVSKSDKQIVKIASQSTAQDAEKSKFKASFELTFQYGQANISKPEGAKPVIELLGSLGQLFGSSAAQSLNQSIGDIEDGDGISEECLAAYQAYIASGGTSALPTGCQ